MISMTSNSAEIKNEKQTGSFPIATAVLMLAALAITLLVPDWNGTGALLTPAFMLVPVVLGEIGAWNASRNGFLGWAIASGLWGVTLVPALLTLTTVFFGP